MCISISFRVLHAPESWSKHFFQLFSTFFRHIHYKWITLCYTRSILGRGTQLTKPSTHIRHTTQIRTALELHSRAASSEGVTYRTSGPNTGSNSKGERTLKKKKKAGWHANAGWLPEGVPWIFLFSVDFYSFLKTGQNTQQAYSVNANFNPLKARLIPLIFPERFKALKVGRDKRANIAALRQAKIYPPRQLRQPLIVHCSCRNAQDELHSISCIAVARALR